MVLKADKLLDEILLGNWNIVQDWVEKLQKELSPEEFENNYSPLAISIELVKLMGKEGLNLAKEYADKVFLTSNEKSSVFTDGMYSLMRNKSGVPFEMEPVSGPFPRGLVPIQKGVGDIAPIDRISFSLHDLTTGFKKEDSVFVGMRDLVSSESLMLMPKNTDLAPQADWRYPERQTPTPTGFRPFMTDSTPGPKLTETTEDSRIFFFGPSFNQHIKKV
jgi:hypothetical protein